MRIFVIAFMKRAFRKGRAYLAKNLETDAQVAIKIAVDKEAETLKSFAEEVEKTKGYEQAGFPSAKLFELGTGYMVKEFISGTRGDAFIEAWVEKRMPAKSKELSSLAKSLKMAAQRGIYIGDLNPKNLIWDGKKWMIIDSGSWRSDLTESDILSRYEEKIISRWAKHQSNTAKTALRNALNLTGGD